MYQYYTLCHMASKCTYSQRFLRMQCYTEYRRIMLQQDLVTCGLNINHLDSEVTVVKGKQYILALASSDLSTLQSYLQSGLLERCFSAHTYIYEGTLTKVAFCCIPFFFGRCVIVHWSHTWPQQAA